MKCSSFIFSLAHSREREREREGEREREKEREGEVQVQSKLQKYRHRTLVVVIGMGLQRFVDKAFNARGSLSIYTSLLILYSIYFYLFPPPPSLLSLLLPQHIIFSSPWQYFHTYPPSSVCLSTSNSTCHPVYFLLLFLSLFFPYLRPGVYLLPPVTCHFLSTPSILFSPLLFW